MPVAKGTRGKKGNSNTAKLQKPLQQEKAAVSNVVVQAECATNDGIKSIQQKRKQSSYLVDSDHQPSMQERNHVKDMNRKPNSIKYQRVIPNRGPIEDVSKEDVSSCSSDTDIEHDNDLSKPLLNCHNTNNSTINLTMTPEKNITSTETKNTKILTMVEDMKEPATITHEATLSSMTTEDYIPSLEMKESNEGLNMFLDDRPHPVLGSVLKNAIYTIVDERLFQSSKFYYNDQDADTVVGYVMNNVGLHGWSMIHKQERTKWWDAIRDYIKTCTNKCRQLVYDRWYVVGRSK